MFELQPRTGLHLYTCIAQTTTLAFSVLDPLLVVALPFNTAYTNWCG